MITSPDVADVSDLELLTDERRHAACILCYPDPVGRPYIALCGRRSIGFDRPTAETPPNVCPECRELFNAPCRRCGG